MIPKTILYPVVYLIFTYLTGAFVAADFNIVNWSEVNRTVIAWIGFTGAGFTFLILKEIGYD